MAFQMRNSETMLSNGMHELKLFEFEQKREREQSTL